MAIRLARVTGGHGDHGTADNFLRLAWLECEVKLLQQTNHKDFCLKNGHIHPQADTWPRLKDRKLIRGGILEGNPSLRANDLWVIVQ